MNIQYYGDFCFKVTTKPGGRATEEIVVWTDPCDKASGLRTIMGQADIVLLSHNTDEREALSGLRGDFVVFKTPGEYAAQGLTLTGIESFRDTENGATRGQNTIFIFTVESLNLCFLGALGHSLTAEMIEKIGSVDVLFVPAGNTDTLAIKDIDELVRKIEPAMIIPMHYKISGLTLPLEDEKAFCKEVGNCPKETVSKLNFKKKDLEGKNMEVVLMQRN